MPLFAYDSATRIGSVKQITSKASLPSNRSFVMVGSLLMQVVQMSHSPRHWSKLKDMLNTKNRSYNTNLLFGVILLSCMLLFIPTSAMASKYTKTKHPILLVQGLLFTFDYIDGVSSWYGIPEGLRRGGATVHLSNQSSVHSSEFRGEQVIKTMEELQAIHGYEKFNLIGMSQGGFDVRYIASVRPDLVASVTTLASPATGSGLIEFIRTGSENDPLLQSLIAAGLEISGSLFEILSGDNDPQNAHGALHTLAYPGAAEFNRNHPQALPKKWCGRGKHIVNGIRYYSMAGNKKFTNFFDPTDYAMTLTGSTFGDDNDGAAGRCASHLGKVLKDNYSWNHADAVNQVFGLIGWGAANPISVYRAQANRLKRKGL